MRADGNPDENAQDQPQVGEDEETASLPVPPSATHCDEAVVRQTIDAVEQDALDSHSDRGISDGQLRITVLAAQNARRALADGEVDPCRVILDMLRDMTPADEYGL